MRRSEPPRRDAISPAHATTSPCGPVSGRLFPAHGAAGLMGGLPLRGASAAGIIFHPTSKSGLGRLRCPKRAHTTDGGWRK